MALEDKTLVCRDCSKEFAWSAGEQQFFNQKGFGAPVRCPDCRKSRRQDKAPVSVDTTMHEITCSKCGKKGEVPFSPRDPRNVLCADCFNASRSTPKN